MDGISFFASRLPFLDVPYPAAGEGVCAAHGGVEKLYDAGQRLCRGCALLRQAYPASKGTTRTRMGLGCYMLITDKAVMYWGNHKMPAPVTVKNAAGAMRGVVRDLILNPPDPPWMFVAFARSNSPDRLTVTSSNDLIRFSGKFQMPGTVDEPVVTLLNRRHVIALHEAASLTRREWEQCAQAQARLNFSPEALSYLQSVYARFPALANVRIPTVKTPEYNAVRVLAND